MQWAGGVLSDARASCPRSKPSCKMRAVERSRYVSHHPGMILCRVLDRRKNPDGGDIVRVELDLGDEVEVSCSQMADGG
jgi:hypothetical protein